MRIHNPICTDPQKFKEANPEVVNILKRALLWHIPVLVADDDFRKPADQ
jgi:hypothetical protein